MTIATIQHKGLTLEVEYIFHKAYQGARDSLGRVKGAGPPLEPDEPAYIEARTIKTEHGDDIIDLLKVEQISEIEQAVIEKEGDDYDDSCD